MEGDHQWLLKVQKMLRLKRSILGQIRVVVYRKWGHDQN